MNRVVFLFVCLLSVGLAAGQPAHRACEEPFSGSDLDPILAGDTLRLDVGYGHVVVDGDTWSWINEKLPSHPPAGYMAPGDMGAGIALVRGGHADCYCMTAVYLKDADGETLRQWPVGSHIYNMSGFYVVAHLDVVSIVSPDGTVEDMALPEWDPVYADTAWAVQRLGDRLLIVNGAIEAAWFTPGTGEVETVALRSDAATGQPRISVLGDVLLITGGTWAGTLDNGTFMELADPASGARMGIEWGTRFIVAGDTEATIHSPDGALVSSLPIEGRPGQGVSGDIAYLGLLDGRCAATVLRFADGVQATPAGMFDDPYAGGSFAWVPWPYASAVTGEDGAEAVTGEDAAEAVTGENGTEAVDVGGAVVDADAGQASDAVASAADGPDQTGSQVDTPLPWSLVLVALAVAVRRR